VLSRDPLREEYVWYCVGFLPRLSACRLLDYDGGMRVWMMLQAMYVILLRERMFAFSLGRSDIEAVLCRLMLPSALT